MRYKILILFICFIICNGVSSQGIQVNIVQSNLGLDYKIRDFVVHTKLSNNESGEKLIGSFFLFDDWKNNCKIQINGKEFRLNNVNFNIQNNEFLSEIGKDSVFTVTPKYIDFITINNKKFKYHLYKGENKFFEVLLDTKKKLSLFKGHHIRIIPKSDMGMLNRPYDEIRREKKFYILNGSKLIGFKLKKKDILKQIDKDKQNTIIKYIIEKKLSYKREKDVIEIFKYYATI
jgi:hypothetical protein